mgnify:CR=1 FL=1
MPKPAKRTYSRYAREAAKLLGLMIHNARVERGQTLAEVAERAGVSRGLAHRVEKGDMGCSIGVMFEIAALVGVRLFDADLSMLTMHGSMEHDKLALLPKSVHQSRKAVMDEF